MFKKLCLLPGTIALALVVSSHSHASSDEEDFDAAHSVKNQQIGEAPIYHKVTDINSVDPSQFTENDVILFGTKGILVYLYRNKEPNIKQPFIDAVNASKAMCFLLGRYADHHGAYYREEAEKRGMKLCQALNSVENYEDIRDSMPNEADMDIYYGVVPMFGDYFPEKRLRKLLLGLQEKGHNPKRIIYFENDQTCLRQVQKTRWPVPFHLYFKMESNHFKYSNTGLLSLKLLGEEPLQWILTGNSTEIGKMIREKPELLVSEYIYQPFPNKAGMVLMETLRELKKEDAIVRAFMGPYEAHELFARTFAFMGLKESDLSYSEWEPGDVCYSSDWYPPVITEWVKAFYPLYQANPDIWEDVVNLAEKVIEPKTSQDESMRIFKIIHKLAVENRGFVTECLASEQDAKYLLFLEMTKGPLTCLQKALKQATFDDEKRRARELYGIVQFLTEADPFKVHLTAEAILHQLANRPLYKNGLLVLEECIHLPAENIPELFEANQMVLDAYRKIIPKDRKFSFFGILSKVPMDGLKSSTNRTVAIVNEGLLLKRKSDTLKSFEDNPIKERQCNYELERAIDACLAGFASCKDEDQRNLFDKLVRNTIELFGLGQDQSYCIGVLSDMSHEQRSVLNGLWVLFSYKSNLNLYGTNTRELTRILEAFSRRTSPDKLESFQVYALPRLATALLNNKTEFWDLAHVFYGFSEF